MTKFQVEATIKHFCPNLDVTELKILEEFCLAVEYRLNQVREPFSETQCLKSWEQYKLERQMVYNAIVNKTH